MANPPKPWKAEYAKSARSSCKTCKNTIDKEKLRLGKMVQATHFCGFMPLDPLWWDVPDRSHCLPWADQRVAAPMHESQTPEQSRSRSTSYFEFRVSQVKNEAGKILNSGDVPSSYPYQKRANERDPIPSFVRAIMSYGTGPNWTVTIDYSHHVIT